MTEHYPKTDKWTILGALPNRSWNMIYQGALTLGLHRMAYIQDPVIQDPVPDNITVGDLEVFPDREAALKIASDAAKRPGYALWLYSAGTKELAQELGASGLESEGLGWFNRLETRAKGHPLSRIARQV